MNPRVKLEVDPLCEHCGWLEPYEPVVYGEDEGCSWCLDCDSSMDEPVEITEKEMEALMKESRTLKQQFYITRLNSLRKESGNG